MSGEEEDFLLELYGQPNQPAPAPQPPKNDEHIPEDEEINYDMTVDPLQNMETSKTSIQSVTSSSNVFNEDDEDDEVPLVLKQETPKLQTTQHISLAPTQTQDSNTVVYEEAKNEQFTGENYVQMFTFGPKIDVSVFTTDLDHLEEKPWRNPGSNLADYFNYGFNEETWRMYCAKQGLLKDEYKGHKKQSHHDYSDKDDLKKRDREYSEEKDDYKSSRRGSSRDRDDYKRRKDRDYYDDKYKDDKHKDDKYKDDKYKDDRYKDDRYKDDRKYDDRRKYSKY